MIATSVSRVTRRRLKRLAAQNEPTIEADRRFFLRRPDRNYRIRIASRAEVESLTMEVGREPSDDSCWYAAVRQVAPGWRLRGFWLGLKGFDTDEPEDICRAAYENTVRPGTVAYEIGRAFEAKVAELRTGGAA